MTIETTILGLIAQYGLPIVVLVIIGWYSLKKLDEYFKTQSKKDDDNRSYMVDRVEKSEKRQEELIKMGRDLADTNKILAEKFTYELCGLKDEVNEIGGKVDILNTKIDSKL